MSPSLHTSLTLLGVLGAVFLVLALLAWRGKVPLTYNVRNLVVRWRTTLLAALAFTLVVALMTVMMAFVNGMYRLTQGSGQPGNVMVLADGAPDEAFSNLGFGDITRIEQEPPVLRDEDGKPLASWEVYIIVNQPIPNAQPGGRQRRFTQLRGIDDPARSGRVHGLTLHTGGAWFSPAGVQPLRDQPKEQAIQAVIGEGLARELGPDQGKKALELDDVFELGGRKWVVVGIMGSAGSTFDSEVWAKRQIVGPMFGKEAPSTVVLRTRDFETARAAAADLSANYKQPAVLAQTELDYFDKLSATNRQFLFAFVFIAFWMALGGAFGVMNTMFAAISQRAKDIGVLRILGYSRWQILVSFFLESLILALVAGALGCAIGYLADGWTASSIVSSGQGGGKSVVLKLIVDGPTLLTGLLFALGMGAVGGLVPALTAMSSRPLQAVR
jgi:ABC-type lipoprotein release transport system permease subunit